MDLHPDLLAPNLAILSDAFAGHGDKRALSDRKGTLSYSQLLAQAEEFSRHIASLGIRPGNRVCLLARPGTDWGMAFFGILFSGATIIPLDIMMTPADLRAVIAHADPSLVICGPEFEKTVSQASNVPCQVLGRPFPGGAEAKPDISTRRMDDVMVIIYTSGTTGAPKGIMATYRNMLSQVMPSIDFMGAAPDDSILSILPLNYMMELALGFLCPLSAGLHAHFCDSIYPHDVMAAAKQHGVAFMVMVPRLLTLTQRAMQPGDKAPFGPRFKAILCGGAPLAAEHIDFFRSAGVTVCQGYGMTETSPVIASNTPAHNRPGSVGRVYPGMEVRIAPDGEILVRGSNVMKGYFRDEEQTRAAFDGDWLRTGDLGSFDAEGYLYLQGRKKDLIILSCGKNVYPEQLAEYFLRLPAVKEACIVHVPDGVAGEGLCLVLHLSDKYATETGKLADEISAFSKALDSYKRPRWIAVSKEPLAKTNSLKTRRFLVEKWLETQDLIPVP